MDAKNIKSITNELSLKQYQDAIFSGLRKACVNGEYLTSNPMAQVKPEYFVTVTVAEELRELGSGSVVTIYIEKETADFAADCMPQVAGTIFDLKLRDDRKHNTSRKGKIDIAVYDQWGKKPICPIELKRFDAKESEVEKDITRLVELLQLSDKNTGPSTLDMAFFACLENDPCESPDRKYEEGKNDVLNAIKAKYEDYARRFIQGSDIQAVVETRTVKSQLIGSPGSESRKHFDSLPDDFKTEYADSAHHFIGVLITLTKV